MHRPTIHKEGQAGQAIVLIAIMMVALIASLGLAIDGGGMYLLYRDAQNAVDAAALTSAFALCTGGDPVEAGLHSLELNGFDSASLSPNSGVFNPPNDPAYSSETSMVEIVLDVDKPSYFIQIVYGGDLNVTVSAISECAGSPAVASTNADEQFAFASLRGPGECTSSTAWNIAGSQFTIEGDVWMPNINPNIEFNSNNTPDPTFADNPADILGNIYIGASSAEQAIVDGTGRELLVEDLPNSPAGSPFPTYTGHGGDGTIEFSQPAPAGGLITNGMDYYRPGGGLDLANAQYHDISGSCDHGEVNNQDFLNPATTAGAFYNSGTNTWDPGIYYSTCKITLNHANMTGNVTWISEGIVKFNSSDYHFTSFGDAPLVVSNFQSSGDYNSCTGGTPAVEFNADRSTMSGRIIAFNGVVKLDGNGYVFQTCVTAVGINQDGNSDSIYQCTPAQNDAQREVRLIQ